MRAVKVTPSDDTPSPGWLDEFEVIAIAEKYASEMEMADLLAKLKKVVEEAAG